MEITNQLTAEEKYSIIRENGGDTEHLLKILHAFLLFPLRGEPPKSHPNRKNAIAFKRPKTPFSGDIFSRVFFSHFLLQDKI